MDSLIHKINSAVGASAGNVEAMASAVSNNDAVLRQVVSGKLGYAPGAVYPRTTLSYNATHFVMPVTLSKVSDPDHSFRIPTDPQITVGGSNSIVTREIANGTIRGTVKELWKNDDWKIDIAGVLMADELNDLEENVKALVDLLSAREALNIDCEILTNYYGITHIVVDSFSFPATDGLENQMFSISATSDDSYTLMVD